MSKRKSKTQKHQEIRKPKNKGVSQTAQQRFDIEKRLPIVGLNITSGLEQAPRLSDFAYEVSDPDSGSRKEIHISQELLSKISEAQALLHFGFEYSLTPDRIASSWPQQWRYLNATQCHELEKLGLPIVSRKYLLIESLQIGSFGEYLYFQTNVQDFFDAWIEIIWNEYVVELELRRFQNLHKAKQSMPAIELKKGVILSNAEAWVPLENCAVRLRAMGERLTRYILPLYFLGEEVGQKVKKWSDLDDQIRRLLNANQLAFYELYLRVDKDTRNSPLKSIRDNMIHKLSQRPAGVVPSTSTSNASLPDTIDELYQLIENEHSRVREAIILVAAIIRFKTQVNKII